MPHLPVCLAAAAILLILHGSETVPVFNDKQTISNNEEHTEPSINTIVEVADSSTERTAGSSEFEQSTNMFDLEDSTCTCEDWEHDSSIGSPQEEIDANSIKEMEKKKNQQLLKLGGDLFDQGKSEALHPPELGIQCIHPNLACNLGGDGYFKEHLYSQRDCCERIEMTSDLLRAQVNGLETVDVMSVAYCDHSLGVYVITDVALVGDSTYHIRRKWLDRFGAKQNVHHKQLM